MTIITYSYRFVEDANSSASISTERYWAHDISVTISLKLPQRYTSYNVSILPWVPINSTVDGINRVTLLYNVKYNISVEVKVHCRDNMITSFYLHYGEMHTYTLSFK